MIFPPSRYHQLPIDCRVQLEADGRHQMATSHPSSEWIFRELGKLQHRRSGGGYALSRVSYLSDKGSIVTAITLSDIGQIDMDAGFRIVYQGTLTNNNIFMAAEERRYCSRHGQNNMKRCSTFEQTISSVLNLQLLNEITLSSLTSVLSLGLYYC